MRSLCAVLHSGNSQSSVEEAKALCDAYGRLLGLKFCDRDGKERPIGMADILVVTPYNAQVNLLQSLLPAGARIGTVDKFQGQEAPVCLVSMAIFSSDELPRDIEFAFSVNRLNVAVSRAQALLTPILLKDGAIGDRAGEPRGGDNGVDKTLFALGASPTSALSDGFDSRANTIDGFLDAFKVQPAQIGVIYRIGGALAGLDLFGSETAFARAFSKLIPRFRPPGPCRLR